MDFKTRRERLLSKLPENSLVLLPGAGLKTRNHDVEYPFHQESSFYYLTGFNEPDSVVALRKTSEGISDALFVPPKIKEQEIWTGLRLGADKAQTKLKFQQAYELDKQSDMIPKMLLGIKHVYLPTDDHKFYKKVQGWINQAQALSLDYFRNHKSSGQQPSVPKHFHDVQSKLVKMRAIKSQEEIQCIEKACEISGKAHIQLMRTCEPNLNEGTLEAIFFEQIRKAGAKALAYGTIAGAGKRSCVLHYETNDRRLKENACVLVDAGCEWKGYASDITRTFPVSGTFNQEQRALYAVVLKAQRAGIKACRAGNTFEDVSRSVLGPLVEGLVELGLLKGDIGDLIEAQAYKRFYPHSFGHWVGLDVHDPSPTHNPKGWIPFQPNMVLTVEPGLYIQPDDETVDKKWRGIGIRIEDVIQITPKEPKVLSGHAPKDIESIENIMREAKELRALKPRNDLLLLKAHQETKAKTQESKPKSQTDTRPTLS